MTPLAEISLKEIIGETFAFVQSKLLDRLPSTVEDLGLKMREGFAASLTSVSPELVDDLRDQGRYLLSRCIRQR